MHKIEGRNPRGSTLSVNRCKYVALTTVTTADNKVNPIMMQTITFFEYAICRLQNTLMGTAARMMSVTVVYALNQYWKSSNTAGSQQLPGRVGFQSF